MNYGKKPRTQADGLQKTFSELTKIDTSAYPDMARQEFKHDADINVIVSRFGVESLRIPLTAGHYDQDLDLMTAIHAVRDSQEAFAKLPADIRSRFPTWESLYNATQRGAITLDKETNTFILTPPPLTAEQQEFEKWRTERKSSQTAPATSQNAPAAGTATPAPAQ